MEIQIGDRFGLWIVSGSPSLSDKGKIVGASLYPCICTGCDQSFEVERRYLISGRSMGCHKCRSSQGKRPNPNNPLCECGRIMKIASQITENKEGKRRRTFHCLGCGTYKTQDII